MEALARNKSLYLLTPASLMFIANIQTGKLFFPLLLRDTKSKSFPSLQWLQRHCNYSQSHAALTITVRPLYIRISLRCEFIKHQMTRSIYISPEVKRRPIWIPKSVQRLCLCTKLQDSHRVFELAIIRAVFSPLQSAAACGAEAQSSAIQPAHIREAIRRYSHKIGPLSPFSVRNNRAVKELYL